MHLRLDAAPAVVSAPSSPERTAEVFRCAKGLVSGGDFWFCRSSEGVVVTVTAVDLRDATNQLCVERSTE